MLITNPFSPLYALSRLPHSQRQIATISQLSSPHAHTKALGHKISEINSDNHYFSFLCDDEDLLECFLNFPPVDWAHPFALDFLTIHTAQLADAKLQQLLINEPTKYMQVPLGSNTNNTAILLICYIKELHAPWKICIPDLMLNTIVEWYHLSLNHLGMSRLEETIALYFYHPKLKSACELIVAPCDLCQKYKLPGKGYGELPPHDAQLTPWHEVAVDLIGPWTIKVQNQEHVFKALTILDTVTNFPEIIHIDSKSSAYIAQQFENAWLSRYPQPVHVICDQGPEFKGEPFSQMLQCHGIHMIPTSVKNPQANAICECLHQTIGNVL